MDIKSIEIISIRKLENTGNLRALVDIRIAGVLVVVGCAVMDGKRGLFVSFPRVLTRDGRWRDVVIVADDSIREHYHKEILDAYQELVTDANV